MSPALAAAALAFNSIVMSIVVPMGIWLVRAVKANTDSQAALITMMGKYETILSGFQGQGGLQRWVEELDDRLRHLESLPTAIMGLTEEIKRLRDWKHDEYAQWAQKIEGRMDVLERDHAGRRKVGRA